MNFYALMAAISFGLIAAFSTRYLARFLHSPNQTKVCPGRQLACIVLQVVFAWLGIGLAQWFIDGWKWQSDSVWCQILWPALAVGVYASFLDSIPEKWIPKLFMWTGGVSVILLAGWFTLPTGESWDDLQPELPYWLMIMPIAVAWNHRFLVSIHESSKLVWWPWVLVALSGGVAICHLSQYGRLGEWSIAIFVLLSVWIVASFIAKRIGTKRQKADSIELNSIQDLADTMHVKSQVGMILFVSFILGCSVLNFRYYSFQTRPTWIYLTLLFLPSLVGIVDLMGRRFLPEPARIALAAVSSAALVGIIANQVWEAGGDDW